MVGPVNHGEFKYSFIITDDFSKFSNTYYLKNKNETVECFNKYKNFVENQTDKKIKEIITDSGKEFEILKNICDEHGIKLNLQTPYSPHY